MQDINTIVTFGDLSPKWSTPLVVSGGNVSLVPCRGTPSDILACCHRLIPCVLVVEGAFMHEVHEDEFRRVVDFGLNIRVLVELKRPHLMECEHLIRIGCAGYLSEDASPAQAEDALRAVLAGEIWASRTIISGVLRNLLRESRHHLTSRESEILRCVSQGLKNSEIAEQLFISPQTVRCHLRSLYGKLGTHDRLSAAVGATGSAPNADAPPKEKCWTKTTKIRAATSVVRL
jgi:DNA-binding NarL/FixJ family response regulator